jgi:hypothetical protein
MSGKLLKKVCAERIARSERVEKLRARFPSANLIYLHWPG